MIIAFNSNIFQQQYVEELAEIFVLLLKNEQHFVETQGLRIADNLMFQTTLFENYLSKIQKEKLSKYIPQKSKSITSLHKNYLTKITVGLDLEKGEILPKNAIKILEAKSKIVIENHINDWKFIKGVCYKYTSKTNKSNIYKLIKTAIEEETLEPETGGGNGQIQAMVNYLLNSKQYQDIGKYKLMALFDSDRSNSTHFNANYNNLIQFLKNNSQLNNIGFENCIYEETDLIIWHILYKKKIENYVPLSVLFNCIHNLNEEQKQYLQNLSEEQLDFEEYTKEKINIGNSKIKEQFPKMFLSEFSYQEFEKRCQHHKIGIENISEMEQILLKIAKII